MIRMNFFTSLLLVSLSLSPAVSYAEDEGPPTEIPTEGGGGDTPEEEPQEQHRCETMDSFQAEQCCFRAERIKSLQQQEFSLEYENGKTLFELQKEHDKKLSELKIQEGILALQEDYFDFMKRLDNPEEQDNGLSQLSSLQRLEADSREAIDRAYRMQFLHEAMEELKDETGPFVDDQGQLVAAEELYQHASQNCQDTNRTDGICTLLNPQSEFNQRGSEANDINADDMKSMMQNYLMAYGVSTENLNDKDRFERHAEYEQSLQKIPASILRRQTASYEESQQRLNELFSKEENQELGSVYNCVTQIRYGNSASDCGGNLTNQSLKSTVRSIAGEVSNQANEILEAGFGEVLGPRQKDTINASLRAQAAAELRSMEENQSSSASISANERESFEQVLDSVEEKLEYAARVSGQRAAETQEEFFSEFEENPDHLSEIQSEFMKRLCRSEGQEYSSTEMLKCLQEMPAKEKDDTEEDIAASQKQLRDIQAQIDEITSSDPFQRINSFKNYYAHETKKRCSTDDEEEGLISYSGQCHTGADQDQSPVTQLLDSNQDVIAEVQFQENGGPERSLEELSDIHEFCYELDDETRAQFDHECGMANSNYTEETTDYSELDPDFKEHISENMAIYDPETGQISYKKKQSTWGMVGISSARAVASSIPSFMQYQQTKMALPFMKDQAMYQKTYQYWSNQQFTANFFRPGGFMSFGAQGAQSYGVSPFNSTPSYGSRVPMGNPQGLDIP